MKKKLSELLFAAAATLVLAVALCATAAAAMKDLCRRRKRRIDGKRRMITVISAFPLGGRWMKRSFGRMRGSSV